MQQPPRSRGAQPGNTNASALRGLYSRANLTAHSLELLGLAREHGSIDDDIDAMRMLLARLFEDPNIDLRAVSRLAQVLVNAEFARHRMSGTADHQDALDAIEETMAGLRSAIATNQTPPA